MGRINGKKTKRKYWYIIYKHKRRAKNANCSPPRSGGFGSAKPCSNYVLCMVLPHHILRLMVCSSQSPSPQPQNASYFQTLCAKTLILLIIYLEILLTERIKLYNYNNTMKDNDCIKLLKKEFYDEYV